MLRTSTLLACVAACALPAAASATTISYSGDTMTIKAGSGEANWVNLSVEDGKLTVSDSGASSFSFPADRCEQLSEEYPAHCEMPGHVTVDTGDGDDRYFAFSMTLPVSVSGGAGDDQLKAGEAGQTTLDGGVGNDKLESQDGDDTLLGGDGNDELLGSGGSDHLDAGAGDDYLRPDTNSASPGDDLVDGGAGTDLVEDWIDNASSGRQRAVNVTLDGQANDGRTGERDDARNVEEIKAFAGGTYVLGDGAEKIELYAPVDHGPSTLEGRGGDDVLLSANGTQTIDGGAGNDRIEAGFGNDTITGGPGRDTIAADFTGSQCGWLQSCTIPHGDDVIYARDGEADSVDCGVGEDKAVVDAQDTVSNCETVERGEAQSSVGPPQDPALVARVQVPRKVALRTALKRGLKVSVSGVADGVDVRALYKGKTVGRGKSTSGSATIRFTKKAKRKLARKRSVKLALHAGTAKSSIKLVR
jgi:Ca2+-binding RTX toxin-like protein